MKEYIIYSKEVIFPNGEKKIKYFIKYIGGFHDGVDEFYAIELNSPQIEIRQGYIKHPDSL